MHNSRDLHQAGLTRLLTLASVVFLIYAGYLATCNAHGPTYKPPPPPPSDVVIFEDMRDHLPPPLTPFAGGPGGPNSHGGLPKLPTGPGAPTGRGGMTKKSRGLTTSDVTWEHWWARNRYQFLKFPNIGESANKMYPATFDAKGNPLGSRGITAQKAKMLALIRPLLDDKSARLRRSALISLGMLNDSTSLPGMTKRLQDGNQTVRDAAILGLGMMEDGGARHILLHVARGTDSACKTLDQSSVPDYFRAFSEVSLALGKTDGLCTLLRTLAEDSRISSEIRAMALEGLGLIGDEECVRFLMEFIEENRVAPMMLATATAALGKSQSTVAVPFLKKCLFSEHLPVRQSAALCLGSGLCEMDVQLVKTLFRAYRHTNDLALKGFSLLSMGRIGGAEAVKYLVQVITKGSSSDCAWACLGLGFALRNQTDEAAVRLLIEHAFSHSNRSTRGAAVIALGLLKCKDAVGDLIRMMVKGDDPAYRGYCAMALGMIGEPPVLGPIRKAMKMDPLPQVKTQAATALALMNDTSSYQDLIELLIHSPSDSIKGFAALSLAFMGDIRIVEELSTRLGSEDMDELTRSHCIKLGARLLSGRTAPYLEPLAAGSNFASEYPLVGYLLEFGL